MPARAALFLFGPTAVGKTATLSALAGRPVEVVSADSMQVYRGMDIGTAKPPPALRRRVPHHLIDIRDPDERYDVGAFVADANREMNAILARGRLPIVAGGTGFYFRHLLLGLPEAPRSDAGVRERVRERVERDGLAASYERLARIDPASAARIAPADAYRITRALEVHEQTGRPLSSYATTGPPRSDLVVTSIALTRPRDELRRRIADRVREMFVAGLRGEVERLVGDGYGSDAPGMRAIGYREFFGPEGRLRSPGEDEAIEIEIAASTRRYAKRQQTFVRQLPGLVEVAADEPAGVVGRVDALLRELDSPQAVRYLSGSRSQA